MANVDASNSATLLSGPSLDLRKWGGRSSLQSILGESRYNVIDEMLCGVSIGIIVQIGIRNVICYQQVRIRG